MATEIFYFRDAQDRCPVQEFLDRMGQKDLARCLAQIDLLEGDDLPADLDRGVDEARARVLSAHAGRVRQRFLYVRQGDQAILFDAVAGKLRKAVRRIRSASECGDAECPECSEIAPDRMKSHREFVAEITLSDPTLAALYSRAREHSQFASSLARLREAAGLTVDAVAERTGLSRQRVESMERGRMPKLATMRRLVDALQARITIAPGAGITIEPHVVEVKRPPRARRNAHAEHPIPDLTLTEAK